MKNILPKQKSLVDELKSKIPAFRIRWSDERGTAHLLEGSLLAWEQIKAPETIISATYDAVGPLLGPIDIQDGIRQITVKTAQNGAYRAKATQIVKGLPVYGAALLVFADRKRGVYRVQSSFWRDVKVTADQQMNEDALRKMLEERLLAKPEGQRFAKEWRKQKRSEWELANFPLVTKPALFLHWTPEGFHPAFHVVAWQPIEWLGVASQPRSSYERDELMVDATKGNILWHEPSKEGMAYTDHTGDGLATLEDSSAAYLVRTLQIVRKDAGDYYLMNRDHTPTISTYDAYGTETGLVNKIKGETDISADSDAHWNATTTSSTASDRRDSQQPETDSHFNAEQAWNYYHALGWDGFDNGAYGTNSPVKVAAHIGMDMNAYFDKYSEVVPGTTTNKYYGYLAFYDGHCDGTRVVFDFMAGDPLIFAHEYQHALTFFGAAKSNGEPGHLYGNDWLGGIREGYSDTFACLRTGRWLNPTFWPDGVINSGADFTYSTYTLHTQPFRRVEFPRSTNTVDNTWYCDHYDDRNTNQTTPFFSRKYFVSSLMSHLAFLVGQGGLHQRIARTPELIPTEGVGLDQTAEIFFYALTNYFDTIPTTLTGPTLIEAGALLLDAAETVSGNDRTSEYVMMRRSLYAMGLYPYDSSYTKTTYGGEAVMLPWGNSWMLSQPYVGLPLRRWQSLDLFVNNGTGADYDAEIDRENNLYARVRNIGDAALTNVTVRFYFAPQGTSLPASIAGWHTCKDTGGNDCVLTIANLAAGATNIADVDHPPVGQEVKWYLDPAYVTPDVDHFCLRAVIECSAANHDNDHVYKVQSNVQHVEPSDTFSWRVGLRVANRGKKTIPLQVQVKHTLPRGYKLVIQDAAAMRKPLEPGEQRTLVWKVATPSQKPTSLLAPYEGLVNTEVKGELSGYFTGELSNVKTLRRLGTMPSRNLRISGVLSGIVEDRLKASISGSFVGELDPSTAIISGRFEGSANLSNGKTHIVKLQLEGCLQPARTVEVTQIVNGEAVGGVTVSIKMPPLSKQVLPKRRR